VCVCVCVCRDGVDRRVCKTMYRRICYSVRTTRVHATVLGGCADGRGKRERYACSMHAERYAGPCVCKVDR